MLRRGVLKVLLIFVPLIFGLSPSTFLKIGSGKDVKPGENLDYVVLNIIFQNQGQKCGGTLIAPQYVLTSATCVFDPVEGVATVVNVTFPQYRPTEYVNSKLKVYIHPHYNATTHADDIAIIKLMSAMTPDARTISIARLETNNTADMYVDKLVRACGMGSIDNYPRPPRVLQCTELNVVQAASCNSNPKTICTQWPDRDNNMCNESFISHRESDLILKKLISYDSIKIKLQHQNAISDLLPETFYYSPYQNLQNENDSVTVTLPKETRKRRSSDVTFRGKPKSVQEIWSKNFNLTTQEFQQTTSLVTLMSKVIIKYLGACIPIILYDEYVENSDGFVLQRLFQEFPSTFIHGKLNINFTLNNPHFLIPKDSKCRSYILFLSDALMTRRVIGPQITDKVIIVPRSSQWKLQEFLASPLSRDIINLLVIGESYSADKTRERPYVLYTHRLYTDGLGSNKPLVLTSWVKGKLSRPHVDLFPTKLTKGFAGHRFSVSAADFPPFVFKKLSTDGVGNVQISWDGYEYRILQVLGKMMNFTFDVGEPKNLATLGPGDAVAESVSKGFYDIGIGGLYVTTDRNLDMEMSVSHSSDCAAFITLASKALPRYRAILGPFQWPVWLCLTITYIFAIIPLAYSDSLSIRYLIEKPGQIENMFWYVFGTFTNSLTFTGELSWSNSKKASTRMLIGVYWVFTIIITACYTGSIIAFVTLPVYPETVDSIKQLNSAFYRIGTLDRGGWERWFLNSFDKETSRLFKKLEFVRDLNEGLGNVTTAYFLFPYAFIGSRAQLEYIIKTNYTDEKLGRRSALHIGDQCFALFGVSIALRENSVYRSRINDGILMLQQSGITAKIMNDVRWDMLRSSTGSLLQISTGKTLKIAGMEEKGLTLADTEGMFLLLAIGFLIASGALVSEWVGGCTNKCIRLIKVKQEQKREDHRIEEEIKIEDAKIEAIRKRAHELAKRAFTSATSPVGISMKSSTEEEVAIAEIIDETVEIITERKLSIDALEVRGSTSSSSSRGSTQHSRASSISVQDLSPAMLTELYHGPNKKRSNIVMIEGKMMSECEALKYASNRKENDEKLEQIDEVSQSFKFLNQENDSNKSMDGVLLEANLTHQVEINLQAPTPREEDIEEFFGEKVEVKHRKKSKKVKK
ncbi:ionotropic receptor 21a [Chironomus tepperi]|uniref:ionotropic receptor 21a n=1 Tax=Chironomus tepperi TaxID=113505 RepID=UPI00391F4EB6